MKVATITAYGAPEVLTIRKRPRPIPNANEALVAVVASTINPVDIKTRRPGTPQRVGLFPAALGWDMAGVIVNAPKDSRFEPGDRVIAMNPPRPDGSGCWQEYVTIPVDMLAPAPVTADLAQAATLPLAGLTADQALSRLNVSPDERLLVTGAAGNVGGMAVQLAAAAGLRVSGLVSRPEHERAVRALGAETCASDPVGIGPFEAVFDTAGVYDPRLLREGGRLITVSDDDIPQNISDRASIADHNYVTHAPQRLDELTHLVDTDRLRLRVAAYHPLTDIVEAHHVVERGSLQGKVVILL